MQMDNKSANLGESLESDSLDTEPASLSDVNSSQPHTEVDSITNILFKGVVNPSGGLNSSYFQYLVNQTQGDVGAPGGPQKCKS